LRAETDESVRARLQQENVSNAEVRRAVLADLDVPAYLRDGGVSEEEIAAIVQRLAQ
jgi:hypothetical protein